MALIHFPIRHYRKVFRICFKRSKINLLRQIALLRRFYEKKKVSKTQAHEDKFSEIDKLLRKYDQYLDHDRGLALTTRKFYRDYIHNFLYFQFKSNKVDIKRLHPSDVISFILSYSKIQGVKQATKMVSSL